MSMTGRITAEPDTWDGGDYDAVGQQFRPASQELVSRLRIQPGERVIDVGCGTGSTAISAARRRAEVVGVDISLQMLETATSHAASAGVQVAWVTGDAQSLPFDDSTFDVSLSTFGYIFATQHNLTARELVRVVRPGGRIGLCSWANDGYVEELHRIIDRHAPTCSYG